MKTSNLIHAKVKYPVDRIRKTKYGDRIKLVATREDNGQDIELWDKPGSAIHYLVKGTPIQLLWDGERYSLLAIPELNSDQANGDHQPEQPAPVRQPNVTPEIRANLENLSADVKEWLSIYSEFEQSRPDLQEATRRAAASTLFMQRCKSREDFNDERLQP